MEKYKYELIKEHADLIVKVNNLNNYIYSDASNKDNKIEYANKCIQLTAMKKYADCLEARLINAGIIYEDGTYYEKVGHIEYPCVCGCPGSDFDYDTTVSKTATSPVEETNCNDRGLSDEIK